jgi:hypothetical protein
MADDANSPECRRLARNRGGGRWLSVGLALLLLAAASQIRGAPPEVLWEMTFPNLRYVIPEFETGGLLLFTGRSTNYGDSLFAISPEGRLAWERPSVSRLTAGEDGVIIGSDFQTSRLMGISFLNEVLWTYQSPVEIASSIVLAPDNLHLFTIRRDNRGDNSSLEFLKLTRDGEPVQSWRITSQSGGWGQPAVSTDGRIYLNANRTLYAFNSDGALQWEYRLFPIDDGSSPVVDPEGVIYLQSWASLLAVNPSGRTRWRVTTDPEPTASSYAWGMAIVGDDIYACWADGMRSYSRFGQLKWSRIGLVGVQQPRVGSDGSIYVIAEGNVRRLVCVNRNGETRWEFPLDVEGAIGGPVLGENGTIYLASQNRLIALRGEARGPHPWPNEGRTPARRNLSAGTGLSGFMTTNGFLGRMSAEGVTNITLQTSENLVDWRSVTNYEIFRTRSFLDRAAQTNGSGFYRLKQ